MRRSGQLAQRLLLTLGEMAKAGVTPRDLDKFAAAASSKKTTRAALFWVSADTTACPSRAPITVSGQ
jgi:methionine aminopeptidase